MASRPPPLPPEPIPVGVGDPGARSGAPEGTTRPPPAAMAARPSPRRDATTELPTLRTEDETAAAEKTARHAKDAFAPLRRVETATLRVVAGRDMLSYMTLHPNDEVVLGRDEGADMILTDSLVSRRHAKISMSSDRTIVVQDLRSTNGTFVNGAPIDRALLRVGESLVVGGVSLRLDMLSQDELEHLANVVSRLRLQNRDPLTGLLTRAWLDEELQGWMERMQRDRAPFACVFYDVDNFKSVNDRHGHHIGDDVLVGCARLLLLAIRDADPCVRYGGEEIVSFIPYADAGTATRVAERVRQDIAGHDWERTAAGLRVTISAGVAQWRPGESAREWMIRADQALLEAKRSGRNRVVTAAL